jgi:hypothetical protein
MDPKEKRNCTRAATRSLALRPARRANDRRDLPSIRPAHSPSSLKILGA